LPELRHPAFHSQTKTSPGRYAIAEYQVSPSLGGHAALKAFREKLAGYGIKLILDFVPNHLGHDHPG